MKALLSVSDKTGVLDLARELPEALKPRAIPIGKPEQLALPG